jgi:uncharacterized membrane protein YfcA
MTSPEQFWLAAVVAALLVGAGKGGLPMVAMLSVPVMSFVMPPMLGAALLLPVYVISDIYGIFIYRRSFSPRNLAILIPASAIGIAVGYLIADRIDDNDVRILIGLVGLSFLAIRLRAQFGGTPPPRPADVPRGVFWGALAGFTSFVSHAGGPAFQVYALPQQMPKMMFAGTSTILFAVINLMKVPPYIGLGILDWGDANVVVLLAPVAVFGAWLGYRITMIIPERVFFRLVEVALLLISVNLIRVGVTGG